MPASNSNWIGGMYISEPGEAGNTLGSGAHEILPPVIAAKNGFGFVYTNRTFVYENPAEPDAAIGRVKYGVIYRTLAGVTMVHNGVTYLRVGGTPIGLAWIREQDFQLIDVDPGVNCDIGQLDDIDSGGGGNSGTIPTCE